MNDRWDVRQQDAIHNLNILIIMNASRLQVNMQQHQKTQFLDSLDSVI